MICTACQTSNADGADNCIHCGKGLYALTRGSVLANRYEILDSLGKGGMGIVYKARDRVLDEVVALKVLRAEIARAPDIARRFVSEIKLARKVRHRNVCGIHEYGEEGPIHFIAMELIEGVDIRKALQKQGALPPSEAYEVAVQIAQGLEAIHDVGVVHRDLKTSNVMRDRRGVVRLMDFGIAKNVGSDTTGLTAVGQIVGTPEYMSPEQAQGHKVDARSDIYALGIVVFELFTGNVPFQGSTPVATLFMHIQAAPPLDGPAAAKLPRAVVPILRQALAKNPDERQASAADVAEALKAARERDFPGQWVTPAAGMAPARADTPVPVAPTPAPRARMPSAARTPAPTLAPTPTPPVSPQTPAARQRNVEFEGSGLAPAPAAGRQEAETPTAWSPVPDLETTRALPATSEGPRPRLPVRQARSKPTTPASGRGLPIAMGLAATSLAAVAIVLGVWYARRPASSTEAMIAASRPAAVAADQAPAAASASISAQRAPTKTAPSMPLAPPATAPVLSPSATPASTPLPATTTRRPPALPVRPSATPTPVPTSTATPTHAPVARPVAAPTPSAALPTTAQSTPAASSGGVPLTAGTPAGGDLGAGGAAAETGELRIGVKPYADVTIDGQSYGPTPMKLVRLSAGVHTVRLVHPDYQPLQRKVTIRPGETARVTVDLGLDGIAK